MLANPFLFMFDLYDISLKNPFGYNLHVFINNYCLLCMPEIKYSSCVSFLCFIIVYPFLWFTQFPNPYCCWCYTVWTKQHFFQLYFYNQHLHMKKKKIKRIFLVIKFVITKKVWWKKYCDEKKYEINVVIKDKSNERNQKLLKPIWWWLKKINMRPNSKTQIVTKLKTQTVTKLKTQIVTIFKNSNSDNIQKLKF